MNEFSENEFKFGKFFVSSKYLPHLVMLFILFPAAVIYAINNFAPCDDTYIFLVYAKNFLNGNGLTYNGTVVQGFSSILWVILLAAFGFITKINLPDLAGLLSMLSGLFALITTYVLAKNLNINRWLALLPSTLLVATGDFTFYMSNGLEEVLFTGMVALSVALSYSKNPLKLLKSLYFPAILAVMILTRPEGALISFLILGVLLIRTRSLRMVIRCGLVLTLILLPVMTALRIYYGYWLPNTFYVKSNAGLSNFNFGLSYMALSYKRYGVISLFGIALAFWTYRTAKVKAFTEVWPLLLISFVWLVYITIQGGDNMVGGRVILPALPLIYTALLTLTMNTSLRIKPYLMITFFVGFAISLIVGYQADRNVSKHVEAWRASSVRREKMGKYLHDNYPSNTLVALNPAGIIPFYSEMPTIDMLGLNDVYIAHQGKRDYSIRYGHQAGDGLYVLSREPDIIIFGSGEILFEEPKMFVSDREILGSKYFLENYHLEEWPTIGYAYVKNK